MIIIGIDPGITGGIVSMTREGVVVSVDDTPRLGKEMDGVECAALIQNISEGDALCFLEHVQALPGQSVKSTELFMIGYGIWQGILYGLKIGFVGATPQAWQKMEGLPRRETISHTEGEGDKAHRSRKSKAKNEHLKALESYASKRWPLVEKWNSGRVAAALIAEYGRRQLHGGA